ncbi:hypothetical protein BC826DRAFT_907349 [Russula brevipes]|nr:hypothetical protein BC826DRAFT_907349 [Russula brevipes]
MGHPSQGHPSQGYPSQGYPSQGHPSQGHPSQGHPSQGYPSQGYPSRGHNLEPYPLQASREVKFRRRGSRDSGVSLNEILNGARISQSTAYSLRDLTPDSSGKISLKVRWAGYHSNTYEVPLSADSSGNVDLPSLGRRTGRAILHFMEQNKITLSGDRVMIHRLENSSYGIWVPVLATH